MQIFTNILCLQGFIASNTIIFKHKNKLSFKKYGIR